jgi:hypothetical protein
MFILPIISGGSCCKVANEDIAHHLTKAWLLPVIERGASKTTLFSAFTELLVVLICKPEPYLPKVCTAFGAEALLLQLLY